MRRIVLIGLLVAACALPAGALAVRKAPGDGMLSIDGGRGDVVIRVRGAVIGRLARGVVRVTDLTPADANEPIVIGADGEPRVRGNALIYVGTDLRFRLIGGAYQVSVRGIGIDVSAVGRGTILLDGDERFSDVGVYSLTGDDCRFARASCLPLPDKPTRLQLGGPPERERFEGRSSSRAVFP